MLEVLKSLHTKQLLRLYRRCDYIDAVTWVHNNYEEGKENFSKKDLFYTDLLFIYNKMSDIDTINLKQLKSILNTREHVMNKKEAALYRKQSAKNKKRN